MIDPASWRVYAIAMPLRFRGITQRQGMIARGQAGWTEFSPFLDYHAPETATWLRAAQEVADQGYPAPLRDRIPVNVTVPATDPATAHRLVRRSGCRTAKVKVAEPGQSLADDLARVEAVRDALGPQGKIRVDANGGWSVDQAERALRHLARYDLEYAEQPCRTVEELADIRRRVARWDVLIAADESIRRADDPFMVKRLGAADIAVLKVQPLGGVRACLRLAEELDMAVVVSSAIETSIGLRAGVALAAALPTLPYACGLNTAPLLADDVVTAPVVAQDGWIKVGPLSVDEQALDRVQADQETTARWRARLADALKYRVGPIRPGHRHVLEEPAHE